MSAIVRIGTLLAVLLGATQALALPGRHTADQDLTGLWLTRNGNAAVEIVPCGASVCGRLAWFADQDGNRRMASQGASDSQRPLCSVQILGGFEADGDGHWRDGWVVDPRSGDRYGAEITLEHPDTLALRGYLGVPLFGKTEEWTRLPDNHERCAPVSAALVR